MAKPSFGIHKSITADRVTAACMQRLYTLDNPGICLACGEDAEGVEPDAERYTCEHCGKKWVYGADQLLILNYYHPDPSPKSGSANTSVDQPDKRVRTGRTRVTKG